MHKNNVYDLVPNEILSLIVKKDGEWLWSIFERFKGYPELEQLWLLMDEVWNELECDPEDMDSRIKDFYSHPVWLLNGLFIEQDKTSLENRIEFVNWIKNQNPRRIADYGGGYGGLARMTGTACPDATIEVIESYPHPAAIALAEQTPNVRYEPALTGEYDVLIATDVLEHVPDPLGLVTETAKHLRQGGQFLIANCFEPVILCHLPQTFHFRHTWLLAMKSMRLIPAEKVAYGQVFVSSDQEFDIQSARVLEKRSQRLFKLTRILPSRVAIPLSRFILSQ